MKTVSFSVHHPRRALASRAAIGNNLNTGEISAHLNGSKNGASSRRSHIVFLPRGATALVGWYVAAFLVIINPDAAFLVNINSSMNVPRPAFVMTRVVSFSYTRTFHEQEANHYRIAFGALCRDGTSTRNYCPVNFSFKPQSHSGARGPSPRPPHSSRPDPRWRSLSFNS